MKQTEDGSADRLKAWTGRSPTGTHVGADGVLQRSEPFVDDAVVLRLDQKLGALPSLQLQEKPLVLQTLAV